MMSSVQPAWLRTVSRTALAPAGGALLGVLAGSLWAGIAIGAMVGMAWLLLDLRASMSRIASGQPRPSPRAPGGWREIESQFHRRQSSERRRRRRLVDILRAYRAAASALPDAVVVVDRNTQRVVGFNEAGSTLLGLRYPDDVNAPIVERLKPLPLAHWFAQGRKAEPIEVLSPLQPATTLSLRLLPYSDSLWLLLARDVSRLLQLESMRRDFVANVSHELRTPLTVLHGYLDMMDPAEQPDWAPMIAEMQRQSSRMTRLVEDLLMLSRLESRDELPAEEVVSMGGMLAALRREAQALSHGRHRIDVDDRAQLDLVGSQPELHSAFSNLVANAVRYTADGGDIRIAFQAETDADGARGAVLSVRDTGYGIPAAHLPRITERFYRVSTSRSRESGGTGLGLSIVKHALGLHQARLDVRSEVGVGSTFSCHFSAARVRDREPLEQSA